MKKMKIKSLDDLKKVATARIDEIEGNDPSSDVPKVRMSDDSDVKKVKLISKPVKKVKMAK